MVTFKAYASLVGAYMTVFAALQVGNAVMDDAPNTCMASDLELVTRHSESVDAVTASIRSAFPRLGPTMDLKLHSAPPREGGLLASFAEVSKLLYEVISNVYALNATKSGFHKFMEAINEISSGYTMACSGPLDIRPTLEDIPKLMKEFEIAYREQNSLEIRYVYGQMLCLNDHLSDLEAQNRQRRHTHCPERQNCSCPAGGITEHLSCPCEFFDCLDKGDQLKPLFLNFRYVHCLAFVIDTTGSMKDEIHLVTQVIKDFIRSEEDNVCYFIVPFNDNGTGPGLSESNVTFSGGDDIIENLKLIQSLDNSLQENSGGDCREYSFEAMKWILDYRYSRFGLNLPISPHALLAGSQIIVLTDAPPKGEIMARMAARQDIINKAHGSGVCVHFFLPKDTFNCLEDHPEGIEEYKAIANATGGLLIDSGFTFSQFASVYSSHQCKHVFDPRKSLISKRDVSKQENCDVFHVSGLSRLLKVTFKTRQRSISIIKPDNTTVELKVFNSQRKKEKLALFSEAEPLAGQWKACVDKGSLEVVFDPGNQMDFTVLYYVYSNDQDISYLSPLPPPGCTTVRMVVSSSKNDVLHSVQLQWLDENTKELDTYTDLDKCGPSWVGNITLLSSGNYSYQLSGDDVHEIPFVYFSHKTVEYRTGWEYYTLNYTGEEDVTVEIEEPIELTFQLSSDNPYGPTTFSLNTTEIPDYSCYTEPSEITLLPGQTVPVKAVYLPGALNSDHEPGTNYAYTATLIADNGCTVLSASKNITITDPNICGCMNGGTCHILDFGVFKFELCNCPLGYRGEKCQFAD